VETKEMTELHEKLERVTDLESFLEFVKALAADRRDEVAKERMNPSNPYGPGANGWENTTIDDFLDAASAWAKDTNMGETQGLPVNPTWKNFAVLLYCGKIYE
jgi:hypothetical protein